MNKTDEDRLPSNGFQTWKPGANSSTIVLLRQAPVTQPLPELSVHRQEIVRQAKKGRTSFIKLLTNAGIIPGITVDTGAKDLAGRPGEKITEGLDGLRERLAVYYHLGARFAKWRAVIKIGEGIPSHGCIGANAHALAR
jgi:fructose-bisphosphate aldolase class 1